MEEYRYAYIVGTLMFGAAWVVIYILRPDLRKQQLFMSCLLSFVGLTEHLFFNEYWKPEFIIKLPSINAGIESILLLFFYGGIVSTLYEAVFNVSLKDYSKESKKMRTLEVLVSILLGAVILILFWSTLQINIIYATTISLLGGGLVLIYFRKDLLRAAVLNGVLVVILSMFILFLFGLLFEGIFDAWWRNDLLLGYRIIGIPIEEVLWHFSLGFAVGPMYKVWKGIANKIIK